MAPSDTAESQPSPEFVSDLDVTFGPFVDTYYDRHNSRTEAEISTASGTVGQF